MALENQRSQHLKKTHLIFQFHVVVSYINNNEKTTDLPMWPYASPSTRCKCIRPQPENIVR